MTSAAEGIDDVIRALPKCRKCGAPSTYEDGDTDAMVCVACRHAWYDPRDERIALDVERAWSARNEARLWALDIRDVLRKALSADVKRACELFGLADKPLPEWLRRWQGLT